MALRKPLAAVLLVTLLAAPALAAPHKAYKPHGVDKDIPTYKKTHMVGPILFSASELTDAQKKGMPPASYGTTISWKKGDAPEKLMDRGYYPCTLGEAKAAIPRTVTVQEFTHGTPVWVDGAQVGGSGASTVEADQWGRNELGADHMSGDTGTALRDLGPGKHTMTVWHQLNYNEWILNNQGYHVWDDRYIALAKATLDITVLPGTDAALPMKPLAVLARLFTLPSVTR
ncbi:MAG: hypothetical protein H7338_11375 [Candidatus Sericytochromatia bacterium]|nr:hypothetical protein [Candidatus Sericytochromatia bacterium]